MIIDSHCHLQDPVFVDARSAVARASEHEVWGIVAVGCDPASNMGTLEVAAGNGKIVWPAFGFHPEWANLSDDDLAVVEGQIAQQHARLVAVGEIGLPWYSLAEAADPEALMARGRRHFERLVALAVRYDLPVVIHAPHAAAQPAFEILKSCGAERAVFHWHKAPEDVTRAIVDAGYFVSVTPEVVYRDRDRDLVETVPVESLLVESDAPWPYKGEFEGMPSGPWLCARVVEEVAKIKRLPIDETMYRLTANTCQAFDLIWA
ncbi:MAG TPA: TatD family hydrolase [Candidatus Methylomirabilis sp.]|nr:TatD family hydrolase [Candidatus Methylomirabilis sp.]